MFGNHDCVSQMTLFVRLLILPTSSKTFIFLSQSHSDTILAYSSRCVSMLVSIVISTTLAYNSDSLRAAFPIFLLFHYVFLNHHTCQSPQAAWLKSTHTSCYFSYFTPVLSELDHPALATPCPSCTCLSTHLLPNLVVCIL